MSVDEIPTIREEDLHDALAGPQGERMNRARSGESRLIPTDIDELRSESDATQAQLDYAAVVFAPDEVPEEVRKWIIHPETRTDLSCEEIVIEADWKRKSREYRERAAGTEEFIRGAIEDTELL